MCLECVFTECEKCKYNRVAKNIVSSDPGAPCLCDDNFLSHDTETHEYNMWCTTCTEMVLKKV